MLVLGGVSLLILLFTEAGGLEIDLAATFVVFVDILWEKIKISQFICLFEQLCCLFHKTVC